MKRRNFIIKLAASCVLAGQALCAAVPEQKPNILLITVDDLKPTLGCYGDRRIISPNIDRLAAKGTVMLANYCQQAVCAPSRVSMFTGLRPDSTQVWDLETDMRTVHPDILTLPEYFKQNGYETVGRGKLIHGAKNSDAQSWTIPYIWYNQLDYAAGYGCPALGRHQNEIAKAACREAVALNLPWKQRSKRVLATGAATATECLDVPDDAYEDGAVANACNALLEQLTQSDKPFFLAAGFSKPHLPFAVPEKYWDLYDRNTFELPPFQQQAENAPAYAYYPLDELYYYSDFSTDQEVGDERKLELIHGYHASVTYMDAQVGKLLNKLHELGLDKNTIIVLWGDHGWHLGDHGQWCKHTNYEQATRAPLIISAPGYNLGQKTKGLSEFVDIFPTLCELAGLPIPSSLEGQSLLSLMKDPSSKVKDYAISQYPAHGKKGVMGYALRTERYRFVMWLRNDFRSTHPFDPALVDSVELYDYQADPLEKVNHADSPEYKDVIKNLEERMIDYFKKHEQ